MAQGQVGSRKGFERFIDDLSGAGFWQLDAGNTTTYLSAGLEALLPLERESSRPGNWFDRIYASDRARHERALETSQESGRPADVDYRVRLPDGSLVWLRDHISWDEEEQAWRGMTLRIDEHLKAEQRLGFLVSADRLLASTLDRRMLLERLAHLMAGSMADFCIIELKDSQGPIVVARSAEERRWGKRAEAAGQMLLGRGKLPSRLSKGKAILYERMSARRLALLVGSRHRELLAGRGIHSAILAPLAVRGHLLGLVSLFCNDDDKRYVANDLQLAEDVCRQAATALDHARLFENTNRNQQRLVHENEMKDEFLALMSHELKTPLTVIFGVSQILPRLLPDLSNDADMLVRDLLSASEQAVGLVEDLMLLARLNLGEQPELEAVDAASLIEHTIADFRRRHADRNVEVAHSKPEIRLLAAPAYLRQVLLNLLNNAQKYSPDGLDIAIECATRDGECVVSVSDRGPGVPEADLGKIFERFYRASNSQGVSGSGMGLAICKRLIAAQGGRIWAESAGETGLKVNLALPLAGASAD